MTVLDGTRIPTQNNHRHKMHDCVVIEHSLIVAYVFICTEALYIPRRAERHIAKSLVFSQCSINVVLTGQPIKLIISS